MRAKVNCPICGKPSNSLPVKSWRYGGKDVRRYICSSCKGRFNVYKSQKSTFTIPKRRI